MIVYMRHNTYIYIYTYIYIIWQLLISFVHRNYDVRACTNTNYIWHCLRPFPYARLGPFLPSESRHARSEATGCVTASCTEHKLKPAHKTD